MLPKRKMSLRRKCQNARVYRRKKKNAELLGSLGYDQTAISQAEKSLKEKGLDFLNPDMMKLECNQTATSQVEGTLQKRKGRLKQKDKSNVLLSEEQGLEREKILQPNTFGNDHQMFMPLDVQIKIEPCEEEIEQMCPSQTDPSTASSSCKDSEKGDKNCFQMELRVNSTTAEVGCNAAEFVETFYGEENREELILPDIASNSEASSTRNGLITEPSVSTPSDTMQIKVEPCEVESDDSAKSGCSCPVNNSSMLSSDNIRQYSSLTTYEILFEVIKYLDDRRNEDKFEAAEKYYALKLRSVSRLQQRYARKLINKVLEEALKDNLNSRTGLYHNLDVQTEFDSSVKEKNKQANTKLQLPNMRYLCPLKHKVLNKMKESLLMCMAQKQSVESYASQLRLLSTVQYSFADKLINEIISEAVLGRLKPSSGIHFRMKHPKKSSTLENPSLQPSDMLSPTHIFQQNSLLPTQKEPFVSTTTPTLEQNPNMILNSVQDSSLPIKKEHFELPTAQTLELNSDLLLNTAQAVSLPTQKESFVPTTPTLEQNPNMLLNIAHYSTLPIIKEHLNPSPTQTLELNSDILLNTAQDASLPTQKESSVPATTPILEENPNMF